MVSRGCTMRNKCMVATNRTYQSHELKAPDTMVLGRKKATTTAASAASSLAAGNLVSQETTSEAKASSSLQLDKIEANVANDTVQHDDASPIYSSTESVSSTLTKKSVVSFSLGAGSLSSAAAAPTTAISNTSKRSSQRRRQHHETTTTTTTTTDDEQSVYSTGSVSCQSASSLGVGSFLPQPMQQPPQPVSSKENTPTTSNKKLYPLLAVLPPSRDPSPLLVPSIAHSDEQNNHSHHDDAISVLSGHSAAAQSASAAARSASPALFLPSTVRGDIEPIRQQRHQYHQCSGSGASSSLVGRSVGGARDDASHASHDDGMTLVSGISMNSSPIRRVRDHQHHDDYTEDGSKKSSRRRRGKVRNPFRRRKKKKSSGGKEGDSVSAFTGDSGDLFSVVSGVSFGSRSMATARSGRSQRSVSTMASTSSRLSAIAKKVKRKVSRKKKDRSSSPTRSQSNEATVQTTPERVPAGKTNATPAALGSGASMPVRRGSPTKKNTKDSPALSHGAVNTTLSTVESYDDDEVSTYSSVISGLSAGGVTTPQRMERKERGYQQNAKLKKKQVLANEGGDDAKSIEYTSVFFETNRALPLLTLEESFDEDEEFRRRPLTSSDVAEKSIRNMEVLDANVPVGLSGRTSTEELMSRLSISTEAANHALGQLRRLGAKDSEAHLHKGRISAKGGAVPHVNIYDISVPDYDSYVKNAVDSFRRRLGILDALYLETRA